MSDLSRDVSDDLVLSFQLESSPLRGRMARLGAVLDVILHQHAYPDSVGTLLAEAIVITVALASSLNYEGVFTLQAKGDGVIRLLVVDMTSDGGLRAYAQFDAEGLGATLAGRVFAASTHAARRRGERRILFARGGRLDARDDPDGNLHPARADPA